MSLIRDAQEVLRSLRAQHTAVAVTYTRKANSEAIQATQALSTVTYDDGQAIVKATVADWLIDVDQMPLWTGGRPQRGDEIEYDGFRYAVSDLGPEGHCWRWHGTQRRTLRVHTTEIP